MSATKMIEKLDRLEKKKFNVPRAFAFAAGPKREVTLPCVELRNGMFLTLRERHIMLALLDEAGDRTEVMKSSSTFNQELTNAYTLLGDYIAAYKSGNINRSDFERCG